MYDAVSDPYCYPATTILINKLDLRDQDEIDRFEAEITSQRAAEPLPAGGFEVAHYRAIHAHLFQDVYAWAGEFRSVRIAKGGSTFCYPEHIEIEMQKLFEELRAADMFRNLSVQAFARAIAHFLSELNAIHPFREGNGRTQLVFPTMISERAGYPINLDLMDPGIMLEAMVRSFGGSEAALEAVIATLLR